MLNMRDEIRYKLNMGFDGLRDDILEHIDKLVLDMQEKEDIIKSLKEEVLILNQNLEEVNKKYISASGELDQTKSELLKFMDAIESMKSVIMNVRSPYLPQDKEVYDTSQQSLDWDEPSINDIFLIIKHSVISNYFEIADKALLILSDRYIKEGRVNEGEWSEIHTLLSELIGKQAEVRQGFTEGLMYFIKTLVEMHLEVCLAEFINKNSGDIERIVFELNKPENVIGQGVFLLYVYFINSYNLNTRRILSKILDYNISHGIYIDKKQSFELLFISMCEGMDDKVMEKEYMANILDENIPEVKFYNLFYDTINSMSTAMEDVYAITSLVDNMDIIDVSLKAKILEYILNSLNKEDEKSEGKVIAYNKEKNTEVMSISFIKKGKKECPACRDRLMPKNTSLAYYTSRGRLTGYLECELLYCEKCGCFYADQPMADEIIPAIRPHKIKLASQQNPMQDWNDGDSQKSAVAN